LATSPDIDDDVAETMRVMREQYPDVFTREDLDKTAELMHVAANARRIPPPITVGDAPRDRGGVCRCRSRSWPTPSWAGSAHRTA
jgi:hypothetical protein